MVFSGLTVCPVSLLIFVYDVVVATSTSLPGRSAVARSLCKPLEATDVSVESSTESRLLFGFISTQIDGSLDS